MGLNMPGKVCMGLGGVAIVVGVIVMILSVTTGANAVASVGDVVSGFKSHSAVTGHFQIDQKQVNIGGTNQDNEIGFYVGAPCTSLLTCPVVTVTTTPALDMGEAPVAPADAKPVICVPDADCTCVDKSGGNSIGATVCTLPAPEIGTYFFTSAGGPVSALSPGRAQEALGAAGSGAINAAKYFLWSMMALGCGCCTLCCTAVFYMAGPCKEDEDGYSSDAKE